MSPSQIAIATQPTTRADVIAAVRSITGGSLAEVKQRLATGAPLIQGELFSDDDFDERVRRLVAELEAKGAPVLVQLGTRTITAPTTAICIAAGG